MIYVVLMALDIYLSALEDLIMGLCDIEFFGHLNNIINTWSASAICTVKNRF